jgi:hypothetical protein
MTDERSIKQKLQINLTLISLRNGSLGGQYGETVKHLNKNKNKTSQQNDLYYDLISQWDYNIDEIMTDVTKRSFCDTAQDLLRRLHKYASTILLQQLVTHAVQSTNPQLLTDLLFMVELLSSFGNNVTRNIIRKQYSSKENEYSSSPV